MIKKNIYSEKQIRNLLFKNRIGLRKKQKKLFLTDSPSSQIYSELHVKRETSFDLKNDISANYEIALCPVSLEPYQISITQWQSLLKTAKAIHKLFLSISDKERFIEKVFEDKSNNDPIVSEWIKLIKDRNSGQYKRLAQSLPIIRHDFILDQHQTWKLVESNSIAAGMGPFSERLIQVQKSIVPEQNVHWVKNPAVEKLSQAIVGSDPFKKNIIIFVIEKEEDNIFDQFALSQSLASKYNDVYFYTLEELFDLLKAQRSQEDKIMIKGIGTVDTIYFRTGYNLVDYNMTGDFSSNSLLIRLILESFRVRVCPDMNTQVATSKFVQKYISAMSVYKLQKIFNLSDNEATLCHQALALKYLNVTNLSEKDFNQNTTWLLKSGWEGGGSTVKVKYQGNGVVETVSGKDNNSVQEFDLQSFKRIHQGKFLMEQIESNPIATSKMAFNNGFLTIESPVSEVGVFLSGEVGDYSGLLIRTRERNTIEAGVHSGSGCIDTLAIYDEKDCK